LETLLKILNAVGTLLKEISYPRVLLILSLGIGFVFIYYTYENRQAIFVQVMSSPYLLMGGTGGVLITALGWIFSVLIRRADEKNAALFEQMKNQIEQLTEQNDNCLERERERNKTLEKLITNRRTADAK